ncbi:universal stress protein [Natrialbaceae archaeon A-arb3/5]
MYDAVFVPTDGSDKADAALPHAIDLAKRHDATLHTQYVVESSPAFAGTLDDETEDAIYGSLVDAGREAVNEIADRAEQSALDAVETSVERGIPHEEILAYVDRHDVDIVVMATAGRTGSSRELIGSVAERVVRSAPVPVVTVRDDEA